MNWTWTRALLHFLKTQKAPFLTRSNRKSNHKPQAIKKDCHAVEHNSLLFIIYGGEGVRHECQINCCKLRVITWSNVLFTPSFTPVSIACPWYSLDCVGKMAERVTVYFFLLRHGIFEYSSQTRLLLPRNLPLINQVFPGCYWNNSHLRWRRAYPEVMSTTY